MLSLRFLSKARWLILGGALVLNYACVGVGSCRGEDVYLSFEELRSGIKWHEPQAIDINGKIVIYENLLFVMEPFKGIHVFDNTVQADPIAIGFLEIPGNSDIYVKNDRLYADSYTDLVYFDISSSWLESELEGGLQEAGRLELAFKDAYDHNAAGVVVDTKSVCQ